MSAPACCRVKFSRSPAVCGDGDIEIVYCPTHAAAYELLAHLTSSHGALLELAEAAGDMPYWNRGGHGYVVTSQNSALLTKIGGRTP